MFLSLTKPLLIRSFMADNQFSVALMVQNQLPYPETMNQ